MFIYLRYKSIYQIENVFINRSRNQKRFRKFLAPFWRQRCKIRKVFLLVIRISFISSFADPRGLSKIRTASEERKTKRSAPPTPTAASTASTTVASATHSGTKLQKSAKYQAKKFVKLIDLTYACNSLTNFKNEGHEMKLCEPAKICSEKFVKSLQVNLFLAGFRNLDPPGQPIRKQLCKSRQEAYGQKLIHEPRLLFLSLHKNQDQCYCCLQTQYIDQKVKTLAILYWYIAHCQF